MTPSANNSAHLLRAPKTQALANKALPQSDRAKTPDFLRIYPLVNFFSGARQKVSHSSPHPFPWVFPLALAVFLVAPVRGFTGDVPSPEQLRALNTDVVPSSNRDTARQMLRKNIRERLQAANGRSTQQWQSLKTRDEWEACRKASLEKLRVSLGTPLPHDPALTINGTGELKGDGFVVEKLVFASRPGLFVTANLFRPAKPAKAAAGILICHSHHNPKTQEELQTMGMTWARAGSFVLVMDQLGHGERRQHPFRSAADYPQEFRAGHQDYWYRYDVSLQLLLVGESLVGWMAGDMMRGVDVLLAQEGIDPKRIILIGAVAGGGDPVAVTAALDERIAVAVPFNFGGPQPENRFPLPEDSAESFPYAGSGSWESTRNLRLSASAGFLPWVIVGGIAPRRLVYAHEFSWDQPRDPVWKRLQTIYGWYDAAENLAFAHGDGLLQGQPPEATHCNNVGRPHRRMIYPALARWFQMTGSIDDEYTKTYRANELLCWTPELQAALKPKLVHTLAADIAKGQQDRAITDFAGMSPAKRHEETRSRWSKILGNIQANSQPTVRLQKRDDAAIEGAIVERVLLEVEPGIEVPLLLFLPNSRQRVPLVIGVSQLGKARFLSENSDAIARLVSAGVAVCLLDVRGAGESATAGDSRDRTSSATSLSATEWMLGDTLLAARLRDLRTAIAHLRMHNSIDPRSIALWGDSFAATNAADQPLVVPHGVSNRPQVAEPLGGLLSLLTALFEDGIRAVYIRRGLIEYSSMLNSPAVHLPHDSIVPGATAAGDLPLLLAALPEIPIHFEQPIDGSNRPVAGKDLDKLHALLRRAGAAARPTTSSGGFNSKMAAQWLIERLIAVKD